MVNDKHHGGWLTACLVSQSKHHKQIQTSFSFLFHSIIDPWEHVFPSRWCEDHLRLRAKSCHNRDRHWRHVRHLRPLSFHAFSCFPSPGRVVGIWTRKHIMNVGKTITGWWFGTWECYDFPYVGNNNHPNWLIFFRGGETTNQIINHAVWE